MGTVKNRFYSAGGPSAPAKGGSAGDHTADEHAADAALVADYVERARAAQADRKSVV